MSIANSPPTAEEFSQPLLNILSKNQSTPLHKDLILKHNEPIARNQHVPNIRQQSSVSDNSSVLNCELTNSNKIIDYWVHSLIGTSNSSTSSGGTASTSSGYESMNRDSNDSDNTSTSSKLKSSNLIDNFEDTLS